MHTLGIKSVIQLPRQFKLVQDQDHWPFFFLNKSILFSFKFSLQFFFWVCVLDLSKLKDARTGFFEHGFNKFIYFYMFHDMKCCAQEHRSAFPHDRYVAMQRERDVIINSSS